MKNLILILTLTLITTTAQAGTLLEPYAGLHVNSRGTNNLSSCSVNCNGAVSGSAVGGRLGFQNMGVMLGLNGKRAWYNIEDISDSQGDGVTTTLGFFVGYDFPILLRVWAEYVFSGSTTWEDNSDLSWNVDNGTTLGLGYKVFPFVSLNLELGSLKFNEQDNDGVSTDIDYKLDTYMLSISIPLSL